MLFLLSHKHVFLADGNSFDSLESHLTDVGGRRSIKTTDLTSGEEGSTWNCDRYLVIGDTWNPPWLHSWKKVGT